MEGVKRIEDLDLSIFCTQGTVVVGVFIPTCIVSFPRVGSRRIIGAGSAHVILSSYP